MATALKSFPSRVEVELHFLLLWSEREPSIRYRKVHVDPTAATIPKTLDFVIHSENCGFFLFCFLRRIL